MQVVLRRRQGQLATEPRSSFPSMKVFISWSGGKSRGVAIALRDWLPRVINSVDPFVSSKDISAGARWQSEVSAQLSTTNFGIVCVTAANQSERWLNFEAGALAKAVDDSHVVPLAIDLKESDIELPLGQFQAQPMTQPGLGALMSSINRASPTPLPETLIDDAVQMWWPRLKEKLDALDEPQASADATEVAPVMRRDRDLLEEVLDAVRGLTRERASGWRFPTTGDRVRHAKFGTGVVDEIESPLGLIVVEFEDGVLRTMVPGVLAPAPAHYDAP